MSDPYAVLGVAEDATDDAIRRRYLELVKQFSPEKHPDKFAAIRQAYESLRDQTTRLRHRLFEAGKKESIDALVEEIACRSPRRRLSLATMLAAVKEGLSAERVEAVLADFRAWLVESLPPLPQASPEPPLDLHALLSQLTALRQEVNLQTKTTRAQQEQQSETLRQLTEALAALEDERAGAEQKREESQDETLRPLLKTLVDLADALALGKREMERAWDALAPLLDQLAQPSDYQPGPELTPAPPKRRVGLRALFSRLLGGKPTFEPVSDADGRAVIEYQQQQLRELAGRLQVRHDAAERVRQIVTSLLTGYSMSLQRVERALQQQELEAIECVGLPFDPETMEVVEVVTEPGRQGTEVLDEVRRGYQWRGRLFRFAQVRVARP